MAQFKPGQSGNPAGRPKGTGKVAKLRASIEAHVPDIIASMVTRACDGDAAAARLLLERTVPPLKAAEAPVQVDLPADDLAAAGRAIFAAVGAGTWVSRPGPS